MLLIQAYDEQSVKLTEYRLQSFTYTTYQTQTEKVNKQSEKLREGMFLLKLNCQGFVGLSKTDKNKTSEIKF